MTKGEAVKELKKLFYKSILRGLGIAGRPTAVDVSTNYHDSDLLSLSEKYPINIRLCINGNLESYNEVGGEVNTIGDGTKYSFNQRIAGVTWTLEKIDAFYQNCFIKPTFIIKTDCNAMLVFLIKDEDIEEFNHLAEEQSLRYHIPVLRYLFCSVYMPVFKQESGSLPMPFLNSYDMKGYRKELCTWHYYKENKVTEITLDNISEVGKNLRKISIRDILALRKTNDPVKGSIPIFIENQLRTKDLTQIINLFSTYQGVKKVSIEDGYIIKVEGGEGVFYHREQRKMVQITDKEVIIKNTSIYSFLLYLCNNDDGLLVQILSNELDIHINVKELIGADTIYSDITIKNVNDKLTFSNKGIYVGRRGVVRICIKGDYQFLGRAVNKVDSFKDGIPLYRSYDVLSLVIKDNNTGANILLSKKESKQSFNNYYKKEGLIFTGDDQVYEMFWNYINEINHTAHMRELVVSNGFTNEGFVYNGNVFSNKEVMSFVNKEEALKTNHGPSMLLEGMRKLYKKDKADLLTLMFFTTFLSTFLYSTTFPIMFIRGDTMVGKSTALNILSLALKLKDRKISVASLQEDDLKLLVADGLPLLIDEWQSSLSQKVAKYIRVISDRSPIIYKQKRLLSRSGLFIAGEELPEEESILNRCIVLELAETDKIGNTSKVHSLIGLNIWHETAKALQKVATKKEEYQKKLNSLIEKNNVMYNVTERCIQNFSYLILASEIFNLNIDKSLIYGYMKETKFLYERNDTDSAIDIVRSAINKLYKDKFTGIITAEEYGLRFDISISTGSFNRNKMYLIKLKTIFGENIKIEENFISIKLINYYKLTQGKRTSFEDLQISTYKILKTVVNVFNNKELLINLF